MTPFVGQLILVAGYTATRMLLDALTRKRSRLHEAWCAVARDCRLTEVQDLRARGTELEGRSGSLRVRFEMGGTARLHTRVRIAHEHRGRGHELTLRREDLATAMRKRDGFREIETGDAAFDAAVFIDGPHTHARAVLDAGTRPIVRELLLETKDRPPDGAAWLEATDVAYEAGELRATIDASTLAALAELLPETLNTLLDAARRLSRPGDVALRLAQTARQEPVAQARLQDLLTLARDFPEHTATRLSLLAGLQDGYEEIRLRCAMALDEEGRDVLLQMASDHRISDSCGARAVAAVRDHLTLAQLQTTLTDALGARRPLVAAAALEALGHRHAPETIPTIVNVLRQSEGHLPVAAARALALSGLAGTEQPLIEALGRNFRDLRIAAAEALGRIGTTAAIPALKETMAQGDVDLDRAARQAVAQIQSRVRGASPGQLSLSNADGQKTGQLSLADDAAGRISLAGKPRS